MPRAIAFYARTSLLHPDTVENQLALLRAYAVAQGWVEDGTVLYSDERVTDADSDASVIGSASQAVTRQVIHAIAVRVRASADARNHLVRMRRAGLTNIIVIPKTFLFLDYALGEQLLGIEDTVQRLVDPAAIDQATADSWLGELRSWDTNQAYLSMILGYTVAGRKAAAS